MKRINKRTIIFSFCLLSVMLACQPESSDDLQVLKDQISDLETERDKIDEQLMELETKLAELDTSKSEQKLDLVTTYQVEEEKFEHFIEVQGQAESNQNIMLSTDMGGLVTAVYAIEGKRVGSGTSLIKLDDAIIRRNIDELQTSLDLASTVFAKQERLYQQNIGSEIQYLEAKAQKESLERKLATVYAQQAKTQIKTPISGVVDQVFLKVGEMAAPGMAAVRIVNLNKIKVNAEIPERYLGAVKKGENVEVVFPAIGKSKIAKVKAVGQVVNPNNRTFSIEVGFDNKDQSIKPNMLATVKINDYTNPKTFSIPTRLIQYKDGKSYVFVVKKRADDLVAQKRMIKTGVTYKTLTEIKEGLSNGDQLIDAGYRDVSEGGLVKIKNQPAGTN